MKDNDKNGFNFLTLIAMKRIIKKKNRSSKGSYDGGPNAHFIARQFIYTKNIVPC